MKKSCAALASIATAGIVLAGMAGSASAANHTKVSVARPTVVVHGNSHSYETVTVHFTQCVEEVEVGAGPATSSEPTLSAEAHRTGPRTFTARLTLAADGHPGRWYVSLFAFPCSDDAGPISIDDVATFNVKRGTAFAGGRTSKVNVARHRAVAFSGTVRVATDARSAPTGYIGAAKAAVDVQFRAAHSRSYRHVKAVRADAHGHFSTPVAVNRTGYFRAVYLGTAVNAGSHGAGHYVHVR